jgi:STAM-binding protein
MSSLDLHTHCGYQSMLPEAIAIVVAPTDPRLGFGVFRLTHPLGLEAIQACTRTGFHPHSEPFVVYDHCSHVEVVSSVSATYSRPKASIRVEDLRSRRG